MKGSALAIGLAFLAACGSATSDGPGGGDALLDDERDPIPLENGEAGQCLVEARACAFERMGKFHGQVGPVRARALLEGCLADLETLELAPCTPACDDVDEDDIAERGQVCSDVIADIQFFADHTGACHDVLAACLEECFAFGHDDNPDDFFDVPFARCWSFGFNGTCASFARDHEACGGSVVAGSNEECHQLCESTDGAWSDDLDLICVERCD